MTFMKKRKAISPVIATVILVAVAITVAVGVSYWMSGISSQYTQFEKIEIQTGYATIETDGAVPPAIPAKVGWIVMLSIKNSGSAASTITHVFVNDVPVTLIDGGNHGITGGENAGTAPILVTAIGCDIDDDGLSVDTGASTNVEVYIGGSYKSLSSGTTVNVKLHSAGGMDYIKLIRLS